jgi:APA family basic amino acid/polyamine antiporter
LNSEPKTTLVRAIGRWSLVALMVNTVIGASIFGTPSLIAARLGSYSPLAYLVAGAGIAVIAACMSELASQFSETGGPYLYSRVAFGQFVGIEIAWLSWLSRIGATSAAANLFITYLSQFFPGVTGQTARMLVMSGLIGVLAIVNIRGVASGNWLSNSFTVTKLFMLLLFIAAGFAALAWKPSVRVIPPTPVTTAADWFDAVLLLVYGYGGFEAALFATGELRNPRKDTPFALLTALTSVALIYTVIQFVVIHTLPDAAATGRPIADSARQFLGPVGGALIAGGIVVSLYGYLSANMLHTPRLTLALGERGDFPRAFAAIHERFRTPYFSILAFAAISLGFSVGGNFRWSATVSAVSRLFTYGAVALALPVMRRKRPHADAFRLPAGLLFTVLGLGFTGVLITRISRSELIVVGSTFLLALVNWLWARRRKAQTV